VGWKPAASYRPGGAHLPVEREPMWDGNVFRLHFQHQVVPLSENQCGMEIFARKGGSPGQLVEREPMWDGNSGRNPGVS